MIGLISCYEVYNYGSQLMSYAFQKTVESFGVQCEHIQYVPKRDIHYICSIPFKCINQQLREHRYEDIRKQHIAEQDNDRNESMKRRKKEFDEFVSINMPLSKPNNGYKELKRSALNYSGIILGSDQVWGPMNLEGDFKNMIFVPKQISKIVYGASFGVTEIPMYQRIRTKHYLQRIPYISTREQQGADLVHKIIGRNVQVVLDPTLLMPIAEWEPVLSHELVPNEPYIFVYFLGAQPEYRQKVLELKNKLHVKVVAIDGYKIGGTPYYDVDATEAGPGAFVSLIKNAEFICTDSFHGTVFSILSHRPFITFYRYNQTASTSANSRIENLLSQLGLMERIYNEYVFDEIVNKAICYTDVDKVLEQLRVDSLNYLENALKREGLI